MSASATHGGHKNEIFREKYLPSASTHADKIKRRRGWWIKSSITCWTPTFQPRLDTFHSTLDVFAGTMSLHLWKCGIIYHELVNYSFPVKSV